ncbi:hypothetical protein [Kamptonema formosum]|uniref:hypothetical protein n=1 Tax=Kamptonema formosum TaxID=331992 RepID=UPI0012DD1EAA|nr:hypothetical protein [Oscillatoria sp. PCC 10802]
MKGKAVILLLGSVLAVSGAVLKGSQNANANLPETSAIKANQTSISPKSGNNLDIIAQYGDSPWNQRISPTTYTNPDTGQQLCFYYNSSRWGPCPGQGDQIIIPQNARCRGSQSYSLEMSKNVCPAEKCAHAKMFDALQGAIDATAGVSSVSRTPPCNGLP